MQKKLNAIIIVLLILIIGLATYLMFFYQVKVEQIILDKDYISVFIGEKNRIVTTIIPDNASDKNLVWLSKNPDIVSVDSNGVIKAIAEGETDVIVSSKDQEVSSIAHVKVMVKEVKTITLSETNINLNIGNEKRIVATISPQDATYPNVTFHSSNEKVIIVDHNGNISALSNGNADIIVRDVREKVEARCHVTVSPDKILVYSISLDKSNASIKIGESISLKAIINPTNADNKTLSWKSSDPNIASVDQYGKVIAHKNGYAIITVTTDNKKTATSNIFVKANPIIPENPSYKYEGLTMKYYVVNKTKYYLSYIWMDEPYNQIKKLDSNVANYGVLMSDNELTTVGKSPVRKTVGQMLTGYILKGFIPSSKQVIAYNASGFYVKGIWNPPSDYYHNRSNTWYVLTDGKLIRNKDDGAGGQIIGIDASGNLKIYGNGKTTEDRQKIVTNITNDKVKNTWSFTPTLIKNGKIVYNSKSDNAYRQGICQIDSNNYVMLTTIHSISIQDEAKVFQSIGCKTAFNLDGGGSVSMFYKNAGSTSVNKIKCSEGSNHNTCRSVVEGIYFTEK